MVPQTRDGLIDRLLAAGVLPDALVRIGIRRAIAGRLADERARFNLDVYVRMLEASPVAIDTAAANDQHYEVPTSYFRLVLGSHMKYSCAFWPSGVTTLDDAERAMLELSCERAQLANGQRILELGCGWGSMTLFAAARFPEASIVAVSNSATQKQWIDQVAAERGLR